MFAFFLSYASGDDKQAVQEFFRDLSDEVRSRLQLDHGVTVGYLARADEPASGVPVAAGPGGSPAPEAADDRGPDRAAAATAHREQGPSIDDALETSAAFV